MSGVIVTASKGFLIASAIGVLAAVSLTGVPADAQWAPPPPEYVATTEPVYYEGHAAYWYGNHWNWRDEHGAWNHYDQEPGFLADHRAHFAPVRHSWVGGGGAGRGGSERGGGTQGGGEHGGGSHGGGRR
ncbi:MAG: hypothetical protein ABSE49_35335 [Polyangiaceae bacterium]